MDPYQVTDHVAQPQDIIAGALIAIAVLSLLCWIDVRLYWVGAAAMTAGLLRMVIMGQ